MLILLNVVKAIALILDSVITLYTVIMFARVILSWIRLPYNQIVHLIFQITEPVLQPIRRRLPLNWRIDFSPLIVFLLLMVVRVVVVNSMLEYVAYYHSRYFLS